MTSRRPAGNKIATREASAMPARPQKTGRQDIARVDAEGGWDHARYGQGIGFSPLATNNTSGLAIGSSGSGRSSSGSSTGGGSCSGRAQEGKVQEWLPGSASGGDLGDGEDNH